MWKFGHAALILASSPSLPRASLRSRRRTTPFTPYPVAGRGCEAFLVAIRHSGTHRRYSPGHGMLHVPMPLPSHRRTDPIALPCRSQVHRPIARSGVSIPTLAFICLCHRAVYTRSRDYLRSPGYSMEERGHSYSMTVTVPAFILPRLTTHAGTRRFVLRDSRSHPHSRARLAHVFLTFPKLPLKSPLMVIHGPPINMSSSGTFTSSRVSKRFRPFADVFIWRT
ncbi:hypothetical protein B0H17DRAFT_682119 [Mycena rosella]|uniref:Uncharacterized protein n=1 Tax=Mycena rosella TaxID=1033263 RepID=A0AAD7DD33_MYCRO|nr:hypothetical protein B0H17DRAFT_682119 [Mycena rosella]